MRTWGTFYLLQENSRKDHLTSLIGLAAINNGWQEEEDFMRARNMIDRNEESRRVGIEASIQHIDDALMQVADDPQNKTSHAELTAYFFDKTAIGWPAIEAFIKREYYDI